MRPEAPMTPPPVIAYSQVGTDTSPRLPRPAETLLAETRSTDASNAIARVPESSARRRCRFIAVELPWWGLLPVVLRASMVPCGPTIGASRRRVALRRPSLTRDRSRRSKGLSAGGGDPHVDDERPFLY